MIVLCDDCDRIMTRHSTKYKGEYLYECAGCSKTVHIKTEGS